MWLTPEVREHLIYWKNPRDSGIIFGAVLVILVAVRYVSIISVLANLGLALIVSTMAFRIYKSVLSAVNKTEDGHPFKVCSTELSFDWMMKLFHQLPLVHHEAFHLLLNLVTF